MTTPAGPSISGDILLELNLGEVVETHLNDPSVDVTVLTDTEVVTTTETLSEVLEVPQGVKGDKGDPGPRGPGGAVGGTRWYGSGPPTVVVGAQLNDEYLDVDTGDLYVLS